jgi:hypothetical protein
MELYQKNIAFEKELGLKIEHEEDLKTRLSISEAEINKLQLEKQQLVTVTTELAEKLKRMDVNPSLNEKVPRLQSQLKAAKEVILTIIYFVANHDSR